MSQMAPMPMMPPAQPVQNFFFGGAAMSGGGFSDAEIGSQIDSFDSGQQDSSDNFDDSPPDSDMDYTDVFTPDELQQATDIGIQTGGDDSPPPVIDTRPRTNIRNVGPTSNLRFDPQFTANILQQQGLDPRGFMSKDDFAQTTQGGATGQVSTSGLPSLSLGQNLLSAKPTVSRQDVLTAANRQSDVAPAATVPLAPTSPFFDRDLLDDPLGLGIRTGFGPFVDAIEAGRARARAFPSAGTPVASLRGGIDRLISPPNVQTGPPSITTIEDDLIQGRGLGENINNPGNIRTGGGFDGEIGRTRDGFAIFDTMQSGVDAINKLSNTYGSKRNINTVREFANRYSPVGENTAKEVAGKINLLSNALGVGPDDKVDFTDPNVQAKLTPAIITSEIGADRAQNVANVLRGFDPKPLDDANVATEPFTSFDVTSPPVLSPPPPGFEEPVGTPGALRIGNQLFAPGTGEFRFSPAAVKPSDQRDLNEMRQIDDDEFNPKVIEAYERGSTLGKALANDFLNANRMPGTAVSDFLNLATTTQNVSPENTAARIARNNRTINEIRADLGSRVPDTALETLEGRRDRLPDQVFDIDTTFDPITLDDRLTTVSPDALARIGREQRIDDANTFRQTVPDAAKIFGGRQVTTTPRGIDQELSPIVAAGIGAPEEFKQPFPDAGIKIGNFTIPTLTSGLNLISDLSRQRVFDAVLNKGATPVYDGDVLVGAKINGVLVEGMDPNAPMDSGDNEDPITKFLKKATEDKEEDEKDEKPPNVIGGGVPTPVPEPKKPTVVKSTAPASTASFTPVGFDVGNLNDLIARITGVPTPKRMQEGGTVSAVDRFLSKVA